MQCCKLDQASPTFARSLKYPECQCVKWGWKEGHPVSLYSYYTSHDIWLRKCLSNTSITIKIPGWSFIAYLHQAGLSGPLLDKERLLLVLYCQFHDHM